ncbi:hypothetical protein F2Q70_00017970 [Brassica cretica]|uniref:Uncharacterized protein n=1 Tax=Brassica cretica TaxID=69181 RepID=A0A8S9I390_BRACR|nr:hypothetical protein F2Q70_00017970 [Brassica cretica]
MASKSMGRSTTVNSIFRFRSQAFVVNITTPSGRIDLPSKLARGFASRLIFGAGCSSDRSVSCEMTLTALPVSTRIFERAIPPTSNAITKVSSWGLSSFTVSCSWKVRFPLSVHFQYRLEFSRGQYLLLLTQSLRCHRGAYRALQFHVRGKSDFPFLWCIFECGDGWTVNRSLQGMGAFIGIIDLPCRDRFILSGEFGIGRSDAIRLDSVGIHSRT